MEAKLSNAILASLFRRVMTRVDRDGQAGALEPSTIPPSWAEEEAGAGRRERRLGIPREILDRSLSQKILDGWLQNRHQVLVPLTFRLGRLPVEDIGLLMRLTAASMLNASLADDPARTSIEQLLRDIGADEESLAVFRAALDAPAALSSLIKDVQARELSPYAYALTVMAADMRQPAGRLFASFIAARLDLPADAVRSIDRRYSR